MYDETLKILVVDDVEDQYLMINSFLTLVGRINQYAVEWAATFPAALAAIKRETFDVCLIDYNLGQHNGLDLLLEIQASSYDAALILMTGAGSREIDLEAMEVGAIDYIEKTELRPDILDRSIRYAVAQRRAILNEQRQREFAEALLDTIAALNSTLRFSEVLERILSNISKVIPHDMANVMLVEEGYTRVIGYRGYDSQELETYIRDSRFSIQATPSYKRMIEKRLPYLVADVSTEAEWVSTPASEYVKSYLGVPIVIGDEVIGFINLDSMVPGFFVPKHLHQVAAFANHAAVAIKNARAYEQAQKLAALEERQRLARELHDAVSQTLFSANVIAETLPYMQEQNSDEVSDYIAKLGRLTKGALAEMRALLLELRPTALEETEFVTLVNNLVRAFRSRTETEISLVYQGDENLASTEVKLAFYRILQEALNNITKHAKAQNVLVDFHGDLEQLKLVVQDDGQGFDQSTVRGNQMGFNIMKERIENIGGSFEAKSEIGQGTRLCVVLDRSQTEAMGHD